MNEPRQSHAFLDLPSRRRKGLKIERLLGVDARRDALRLLEIGTGSGGIAHYFATHPSERFDVDAVDVRDVRQITDAYRFQLVESTQLPFTDASFDIVISNHVIEHVGDRTAQLHHLAEIRRVMAPSGLLYLAVPNRWMVVEPHYKLPFLSWLPHAWRTPYLRASGKGKFYDCEPLRRDELEALIGEAGLRGENRSIDAFRQIMAIEEGNGVLARMVSRLPDALLRRLTRIIPTHIYTVRDERDERGDG
jgi:SAM-dependent methyltransferase